VFNLKRNKKGSLQDIIFGGVILLVAAIVILISFKLAAEFNTNIQADASIPTAGKTASSTLTNYFPSVVDNVFLLLTIGIAIATLVMAALVRVHPIFLVFFLIGLILIIFISGILSNVYDAMATDIQLATQANQLNFISFIMTRLPFIVGVIGVLLMIVMYKVWQVEY